MAEHIMTKILNYLWRAWLVLLAFTFIFILGIPVLLLSINKNHYKYAYVIIRFWCLLVFYGMGFRYELVNLTDKKIDKKRKYIFIANHTSLIDVFLPVILHPDHPLFFVGKKELNKVPIFNLFYRRVCVMVDRKDPKSRASVYPRCAERMNEGKSVVLFPEGGVSDDTSIVLDTFKDGAFKLATQHQFPIAVYAYKGLKEMFPFDNSKGFPGKVTVYFIDVLEPEGSAEELKQRAFDLIKNTLEKKF